MDKELIDFIIGNLVNIQYKLELLKESGLIEPTPEQECLKESVTVISRVWKKVANLNSYTDKDVYTVMQKYK